jgi:hypothetical protein
VVATIMLKGGSSTTEEVEVAPVVAAAPAAPVRKAERVDKR